MVRVVTPGLHKGAPHAALVEKQSNSGGRNHHGRITTRHIGGGHKQHYRIIDFKRDKEGIPARVERIEYDPNRTAHIALLCYVDGERRYIIAPKGLKAGDQVIAGRDAPIKAGNTLPLRNIPVGSTVHCIEMKPGKGAQIARAAGAGVQQVAEQLVQPRVLQPLPQPHAHLLRLGFRAVVPHVGKQLFTRHIFLGIHRFRLVFRRTAQKRASRRRSSCGSA